MQPVVKITSELVFFHHPLQVPIGCGDEPDVRPDSAIAADTLKLLVPAVRRRLSRLQLAPQIL